MGAVAKIEGPRLTEQQERFVAFVLAGAAPEEAKELAGYSPETPVYRITCSAAVQAALDAGCGELLRAARPLAINTLITLASSGPAAQRFSAAKHLEEMTAPKADAGEKPLTEMGIDELEDLIRRKEAELRDVTPGNGAHQPVDHSPAP